MIRVANVREFINATTETLTLPLNAVYIGRSVRRYYQSELPDSPLATPFVLDHECFCDEYIHAFALILTKSLHLVAQRKHRPQWAVDAVGEMKRLSQLAAAGDLILVCWCAPRPCHGDVIKQMLESKTWATELQNMSPGANLRTGG